ncbi:hypothetical protein LJC46_03615 [Desulfovibrio sp. OttesenSCG-928-G15]|nr:hypothetical protein [Desulfovibrio sp. OttesenSCG-928-G15]
MAKHIPQPTQEKQSTLMSTLLLAGVMLLFFCQSAMGATVPQAASAAGREMDRQLVQKLQQGSPPAKGVSLSIVTPTNINNLETSCTLARQMQEEISRWFVQAGYSVVELRKGRDVLFEPQTGEMLLTRKNRLLGAHNVNSTAIVTGTYTIAPGHVRFNIRMICTNSRQTLAMSTVTLPMNREIKALARSGGQGGCGSGSGGAGYGLPMEPTVVTLLP